MTDRFHETRRILLSRYSVEVRMGVHDFEQDGPQRVWVTVELWLNKEEDGPKHDEIGEVLDYDFLRKEIGALAASRHFNLQETFAEAILEICFARAEVSAALVRTEKPDVYADTESVGFELYRARES